MPESLSSQERHAAACASSEVSCVVVLRSSSALRNKGNADKWNGCLPYCGRFLDMQAGLYLRRKANMLMAKVLGERHPRYASSLSNLANLYLDMGAYEQAESLYVEAKTLMAKVLGEQHPDYARSLGNLANLYLKMDAYEKAEPLYVEAKTLMAKLLGEQHQDYAISLNDLASLYSRKGAYEKAEPLYVEAKTLMAKLLGEQHPDYAKSLMNLADLYSKMGAYEKAEPLYVEAKTLRAKVLGEQHPHYATSLKNLADLYLKMCAYEKAEPLYGEANALTAKLLGEQHPDYARSLNSLANLYLQMDAYEKAEPLYVEAKTLMAKLLGEQHPDYARVLENMAECLMYRRDYDKAEVLYVEVRNIRKEVLGQQHPEYIHSAILCAAVAMKLGKCEGVIDTLEDAVANQKQMLLRMLPVVPEIRRMQLLRMLKEHMSYLTDAAINHFQFDEVALWRLFVMLSERNQLTFATRSLAQLERSEKSFQSLVHARRRMSRACLGEGKFDRADFENIIQEINDLEIAAGNGSLVVESPSFSSQCLAKALQSKHALVQYIRYQSFTNHRKNSYAAFVIHPHNDIDNSSRMNSLRIHVLQLGDSDSIDTLTQKFRQSLAANTLGSRTRFAAMQDVGRHLRRLVLDPVLDVIQQICETLEHLIILPDSELSALPFAALPGDHDNEYVLDYDLVLSYMLQLQDLTRPCVHERTIRPPVVIAAAEFGQGKFAEEDDDEAVDDKRPSKGKRTAEQFNDLAYAEHEGKLIAHLLSKACGMRAELLTGSAATVRAFLSVEAPCILHVASHGFSLLKSHRYDHSNGRLENALGTQSDPFLRSGIAFTGARAWQQADAATRFQAGIATALDVRTMNLKGTHLASISACNSGIGDAFAGEGTLSLGYAFILAGAQSVIVTLLEIPDQSAHEVMQGFYHRALSRGASGRAEALRDAQREVRRKEPRVPWKWGAFVLFGDYTPLALNFGHA